MQNIGRKMIKINHLKKSVGGLKIIYRSLIIVLIRVATVTVREVLELTFVKSIIRKVSKSCWLEIV
jgi:hypothetical protein